MRVFKSKINLVVGVFVLFGAILALNPAPALAASCGVKNGNYDGVDWQITANCELLIGSSEQTQTLADSQARSYNTWPWYDDTENITSVDFVGSVIAQGSLTNMFDGMKNLTAVKNASNLDTTNVTDMHAMFLSAELLSEIDVSTWNTAKVTDMSNMFTGAKSLTSADVSNWNTSSVTNMESMFYGAEKLAELDFSSWNTANVEYMQNMFAMNNPALEKVTFGDGWTKWIEDATLPRKNAECMAWVQQSASNLQKTSRELYNELPSNISTYKGTWIWGNICSNDDPEEPILPEDPVVPVSPEPTEPANTEENSETETSNSEAVATEPTPITAPATGERGEFELYLLPMFIMLNSVLVLAGFGIYARD